MAFTRQAFGRIAALLLGIGFLILLTVGVATLYLVKQTRHYADSVTELQYVRQITTATLSQIQDAETGQRGYLLTGDPAYLAPYRTSAAALPGLSQQLERHLAHLPGGPALNAELRRLVGLKLAELQHTVALQQAGQHEQAMAVVRGDLGKQLMDQLRAVMADILQRVDRSRDMERAGLFSRANALLYATWAGLIMMVLVGIAAAFVVVRYTNEIERAQREIEQANASLEDRVRDRTAELEAANEEVQRFAYIVSHDLRAPLVNVMGFTAELEAAVTCVRRLLEAAEARDPELVSKEARDAVETDLPEAVTFIRTSTQRMDRLINAILKLSREGRRNLSPERITMAEMFQSIATTVQHQLQEADAEVVVKTPMPDPVSDRLALEQVFGNLIDNAVKYLDRGRPGRVIISGVASGTQLRYDIQDNGRGIEPKDRDRVFELFRRAGKQDRPGEGIGLAHVRALVRRLGGTIDFTSEPGQGTTFTVRLPRTLTNTANA